MNYMNYNRLQVLKLRNNLSDLEMANIVSITLKGYKTYETGIDIMPADVLAQYCLYFNVSLEYIYMSD